MLKITAARVTLGWFAMLLLGACNAEPAQTSDFGPADPPAERMESAKQPLSACVDIRRGVYGTGEDTFLTSLTPGSANGNYVNLYCGLDGAAEKEILLRFDLSFIPAGSVIVDASLKLFQTWKVGSSTVRVHRNTTPWTEATATWTNSAAAHDAAVATTLDARSGFGERTADMTELVQSWVNGTPNYGITLEEPLVQRTVFRSSETPNPADRPDLTVCYTTPTCDDGTQNQGETGVDCGGPCTPCTRGVRITPPGIAYGAHGSCDGWNVCGDAETCALWACQINGYSQLVSYGATGPCSGFRSCNLFFSQTSIQWDWGNWCEVSGVSDITCAE